MARRSLASGLQVLFSPGALIPFLIGSVAVAVLGSAVYQLLSNWLGTTNVAAVRIILGALVVVLTAAWVVARFVNRARALPPLVGKTTPATRKGLIVLVSNNVPVCRAAIEWHEEALEKCWLICSAQTAAVAQKLREELEKAGKQGQVILVNDVFDPLEFRSHVESVFNNLPAGWAETDVVFDFTGMTACASVGGVLACLKEERSIQYTPASYDATLKAQQPLPPVEITLHWGLFELPSSLPGPAPQPSLQEVPPAATASPLVTASPAAASLSKGAEE